MISDKNMSEDNKNGSRTLKPDDKNKVFQYGQYRSLSLLELLLPKAMSLDIVICWKILLSATFLQLVLIFQVMLVDLKCIC